MFGASRRSRIEFPPPEMKRKNIDIDIPFYASEGGCAPEMALALELFVPWVLILLHQVENLQVTE